jgi:hypothetical protein
MKTDRCYSIISTSNTCSRYKEEAVVLVCVFVACCFVIHRQEKDLNSYSSVVPFLSFSDFFLQRVSFPVECSDFPVS